jgi:hypothetical protein
VNDTSTPAGWDFPANSETQTFVVKHLTDPAAVAGNYIRIGEPGGTTFDYVGIIRSVNASWGIIEYVSDEEGVADTQPPGFTTLKSAPTEYQTQANRLWETDVPFSVAGYFQIELPATWYGADDAPGPDYVLVFRSDAIIQPVPEPSTLALLGAGIIGLGAMRRRKVKA